MEVLLLGAPSGAGAGKPGCEDAPRKLRELGLLDMIRKYRPAVDKGDSAMPDEGVKSENLENDKIFNYNRVIGFNRVLAGTAAKIAAEDDFTLFLGGDHSVSAATISGILSRFPDTAVIWLDAHADLNTFDGSASQNTHGMSGAALLGLGGEKTTDLRGLQDGCYLDNKLLFLLGQRKPVLDPDENALVRNKTIYMRTWEEMRLEGVVNVLQDIFAEIKKNGASRIHLSFDLDVLDARLVPGTGIPVENGPDIFNIKLILRALAGSGYLKSMDFVEYNPSLDTDGSTGRLSIELLEEVFKNI